VPRTGLTQLDAAERHYTSAFSTRILKLATAFYDRPIGDADIEAFSSTARRVSAASLYEDNDWGGRR